MKKIILTIVLTACSALSAYAANFDNPLQGKLKAVYSDYLTMTIPSTVSKSPEINTNPVGDIDIKIVPSTAYDNFDRLTDLKQGDQLSVTYNENNSANNKVADHIERTRLASDPDLPPTTTIQTVVTTTTLTHNNNTTIKNY